MAPQRVRNPNSRAQSPNPPREKTVGPTGQPGIAKGKKPPNMTPGGAVGAPEGAVAPPAAAAAAAAAGGAGGAAAATAAAAAAAGLSFPDLPRRLLHAYRSSHHLACPSSFASQHNQFVLADPNSLGRLSPTMSRARERRRVGKEVLARAVRKDFMDQAVSEMDVTAAWSYVVRSGDRKFRMCFSPQRAR